MKISLKSIILAFLGSVVFVVLLLIPIVGIASLVYGKIPPDGISKVFAGIVWIPGTLFHGYLLKRISPPETFIGSLLVTTALSTSIQIVRLPVWGLLIYFAIVSGVMFIGGMCAK